MLLLLLVDWYRLTRTGRASDGVRVAGRVAAIAVAARLGVGLADQASGGLRRLARWRWSGRVLEADR